MRSIARVVRAVNRLRVWRRSVCVGPDRLHAPSFDRLVYLWMQKMRRGRRAEWAFLQACVRPGMHVIDDGFLDGMPVDFIKVDVQGWEVKALRGMARMVVANPSLRLYVELWPYGLRAAGSSAGELLALIEQYGFRVQSWGHRGQSAATDFAAMADREFWFTDLYASRP